MLDAPCARCYRASLVLQNMQEGERRIVSRAIVQRLTVTLVVLGTVCCSGVWQVAAAFDALTPPYGPLRLVNQQPVQLLFLQPFPDRTDVTPPGHLDVHLNTALTNTLVEQQQDFAARLDLEMVRAVFDLHYGVYPHLEVGLDIPLMYTYGGILDSFVLGVERLLTPKRERGLRKRQVTGAFTYQVVRGNRPFIRGQDDAIGLGDVVLKAKAHLLHAQAFLPALSLRAAVKFPSGDTSRAFGSGEIDGSFGLLMQKTLGRWTFYVNGDVTFPGQAFKDVGVSLQPFFNGLLAIEFRLSNPVSLVAQLRGDTRPFHHTIPSLDKRLIQSLLGVNWAITRHLILQAGLDEDQFNSACCSADVSFFLNLTGRL